MKEPLIFVSVSVEKELPKEDGEYYVARDQKDIGTSYFDNEEFHLKTTHWLKPFSLPELMEEFARECRANERFGGQTDNELVNDFLTQKGLKQ